MERGKHSTWGLNRNPTHEDPGRSLSLSSSRRERVQENHKLPSPARPPHPGRVPFRECILECLVIHSILLYNDKIKYSALLKSENKKLEFIVRMKCFLHSWGRMETAYCSEDSAGFPCRPSPAVEGIRWEGHDRSQLFWNSWGRGWLGAVGNNPHYPPRTGVACSNFIWLYTRTALTLSNADLAVNFSLSP